MIAKNTMLNATRLTPPIDTARPSNSAVQQDIETGQRSPASRAVLHQPARPAGLPIRPGLTEGFADNGSGFMMAGTATLLVAGAFITLPAGKQNSDSVVIPAVMAASFGAIGLGMVAVGFRDRIALSRQQARAGEIATPPATPTAEVLPTAPRPGSAV